MKYKPVEQITDPNQILPSAIHDVLRRVGPKHLIAPFRQDFRKLYNEQWLRYIRSLPDRDREIVEKLLTEQWSDVLEDEAAQQLASTITDGQSRDETFVRAPIVVVLSTHSCSVESLYHHYHDRYGGYESFSSAVSGRCLSLSGLGDLHVFLHVIYGQWKDESWLLLALLPASTQFASQGILLFPKECFAPGELEALISK